MGHIDYKQFRADIDRFVDQDPTPRAWDKKKPVADGQRRLRGLLDTSVVIDIELLSPADLPVELAVSAITMAELATGPQAATDAEERARRIALIQRAEERSTSSPSTSRWHAYTGISTPL